MTYHPTPSPHSISYDGRLITKRGWMVSLHMADIVGRKKKRGLFIGVTTLARLKRINLRQDPNPTLNTSSSLLNTALKSSLLLLPKSKGKIESLHSVNAIANRIISSHGNERYFLTELYVGSTVCPYIVIELTYFPSAYKLR